MEMNSAVFKILLSECENCNTTEEKTLYYFQQKDISRLLLLELGKQLSYMVYGVENENSLSEENLSYIEFLRHICKRHLENSRIDGKTLSSTVLLPEFVSSNNKLFYQFTEKFSGNKFSLEFIQAYKKELERIRKFEKRKTILVNIHSILGDFLYIDDRKKQEKNINLFLKKLGNIFINYSYENAVTFMGREEDEPEDTILSLDFRDKNQVNLIVDRLGTYGASERVYSSGFKNFDMRFLNGGFEPGRIYIFAGKPGQGKSALLLNFAYNAALKESENGAVLYITLENSVEETINRLLKILVYDVTGNREAYKDIRKDKQKMKDILLKHFSDKRFIIKYFHPNFPTSDLLSWIATLQQKEKISIIFIDYLSLLTSTKAYEQKRHELGQITLELKKMSRIFNVPIVTAAQLNTAGYDIIPTMKNIDESRQVAQHADFIGLLFDDKTDSNLNLIDECQMVLGINIDKNRNGPRGIARFLFDSLTMKLKEITKTGEKIVVAQNDDIEEIIKEEDHNIMDIEEVSDLLQEDPLGNI